MVDQARAVPDAVSAGAVPVTLYLYDHVPGRKMMLTDRPVW